jgi:hypothetical protein
LTGSPLFLIDQRVGPTSSLFRSRLRKHNNRVQSERRKEIQQTKLSH